MPIHYVCVACREESFLPDSKAGTLQGCPRCRLKFLAPAPNVQVVPVPGAAPARPSASTAMPPVAPPRPAPLPSTPTPTPGPGSSRPNFGGSILAPTPARPAAMPARPGSNPGAAAVRPTAAPPTAAPPPPMATAARVAPPPSYPRDAAKPPLYPLTDSSRSAPPKPGTKPAPQGAQGNPPTKGRVQADSGMFGVPSSTDIPSLFGSDEDASDEPGELFADAIPSSPESELDEELDVPISSAPRRDDTAQIPTSLVDSDVDDEESAHDEGGGVAVPEDSDTVAALSSSGVSRKDTDVFKVPPPPPQEETSSDETVPIAADSSGLDALISMDDLFGKPGSTAPLKAPAPKPAGKVPGLGGVIPAPHLKPIEPAPAPAPAPATHGAHGGPGIRPFVLTAVEGIADGPFALTGGEVYLLGRDKDAQVKILSTSVSRRHARIDGTGHEHILIDLGSANGTQVNGQSVARHPLKEGDIIRMGKVLLRYSAS